MTPLAIALAGALGALTRHGLGVLAGPTAWPWPTLGINVAGSFLLGLVATWGSARLPGPLTVALGVGFLGAFTTYSTFSVQTVGLVREGRLGQAAGYVAASLVLGLGAAAVGLAAGRALVGDGAA